MLEGNPSFHRLLLALSPSSALPSLPLPPPSAALQASHPTLAHPLPPEATRTYMLGAFYTYLIPDTGLTLHGSRCMVQVMGRPCTFFMGSFALHTHPCTPGPPHRH